MLTIEADVTAKVILISTDEAFRDKDRILEVAGARYNLKNHIFTAPLTWATCCVLRGVFKDELVIGPLLQEWAYEYYQNFIGPGLALRLAWDAEGDQDLYPFQRAGVQFLAYARKALLLDPMGTGKTPQTIRTLAELVRRGENPFPVVVVAPNNMVYTWQKEFAKWYPGVKVGVVKGSKANRDKVIADRSHHVLVLNFEGVRTHSKLAPFGSIKIKRCIVCDPTLPNIAVNQQSRCEHCKKELNQFPFRTVIVDEAHRLKDPKAKQTRAVWALASPSTEFIYGLTGTAIADSPVDMYSALHLIAPREFPSRSKYIDRFCVASFNMFGGMTVIGLRQDTKDEFFQIVDPRMRRMPKDAVLPFLPKKTYSTRMVEMTPKQAKAYKQMQSGLLAQLDDAIAVAANPLTQLTRLSQFASAYAEIETDEQGLSKVRLTEPSNKIDALIEILDEMGEEPAVVFAQSRQLIELAISACEKHKISYARITGGQTAEQREIEKEAFQAGQRRVILCTIAAGGVGITLTRAGTAIFLQRSWSMIDNSQAEDRVHRIGSEIHDKIEIIDIISPGTIEEGQRVVLSQKAERLEEVMRDREALARLIREGRVTE